MVSAMNGRKCELTETPGPPADVVPSASWRKFHAPGSQRHHFCPPLRPEQASALSAAFLRDTTTNIAQAALSAPISGYAAYAPLGTEEALIPHLAKGTICVLADGSLPVPHCVEGFGLGPLHAIQQMLAAGHAAACALSSGTPTLPTEFLIAAAEALPRRR